MKKLYEFYWDYSRYGELEGLFIAEEEDVDKLIGETVYFGEVLGKHSEVFGSIDKEDIIIKSEDQGLIRDLQEVFSGSTLSGYNPLDYYEPEED